MDVNYEWSVLNLNVNPQTVNRRFFYGALQRNRPWAKYGFWLLAAAVIESYITMLHIMKDSFSVL